jgi:hypothetical protein
VGVLKASLMWSASRVESFFLILSCPAIARHPVQRATLGPAKKQGRAKRSDGEMTSGGFSFSEQPRLTRRSEQPSFFQPFGSGSACPTTVCRGDASGRFIFRWLSSRALLVCEHLRAEKITRPGVTRIEPLVMEARERGYPRDISPTRPLLYGGTWSA